MKLPHAVVAILKNALDPRHEPTCTNPLLILDATYCPFCTGYRGAAIQALVRDSEKNQSLRVGEHGNVAVINLPTTTWTVSFEGEDFDGEYFPPDDTPGLASNYWQFERQHRTMEGFETLCMYPDLDSEGGRLIHGHVENESGQKLGRASVLRVTK